MRGTKRSSEASRTAAGLGRAVREAWPPGEKEARAAQAGAEVPAQHILGQQKKELAALLEGASEPTNCGRSS